MYFDKVKMTEKLPKHIAFIIDGNGRWAKRRGLPRSAGHKVGADNVKRQIQNAIDFGIKNISFYCFSTENWNRPKNEVDYLMKLFDEMLSEYLEKKENNDCKIMISGDLFDVRLPKTVREKAFKAIESTKNNNGLVINFCINYGGRREIINAINYLVKNQIFVSENDFGQYLYTKDLLPLDMVVRTSGEQRISNFMPWQSSYAEFCFYKKYWPDFSKKDFQKVLLKFAKRNRRFGAIGG